MGFSCWKKNYGGNCYTVICFSWSIKSFNLSVCMLLQLMYGLLGLTMGSLWRLRASWGISVCLTAVARALGATCYVVMYSFLIRENILSLITINIHASLTYILTALGFITIPSMNTIYAIFGILLLMNCGFFVFLLHLLYSVFFTRLGMKESLRLPGWLDKAI
ncbi:uncharacterized protein LOC108194126 isoform X3 [Daucus carota subsp. sativus]|uniref:uncharacterized protein LOC108194126 isoform X3 n=1 Tax=Daucus carota subsp. sativus TaxID=79200 RepID=UPI00308319D7